MVRLNKIYTKTGDAGTTALGDGSPDASTLRRLSEELTGRLTDAGASLSNMVTQLESLKTTLEEAGATVGLK